MNIKLSSDMPQKDIPRSNLETLSKIPKKLFGSFEIDKLFSKNLVAAMFPSPTQSSVVCFRGRSSTGDSYSQTFLDMSGESSLSPAFSNNIAGSATNLVDGTTIFVNQGMERESHVPEFSFAIVDVPLSIAMDDNNYVRQLFGFATTPTTRRALTCKNKQVSDHHHISDKNNCLFPLFYQ
ncbi:unnamed protein product [Orchesella dallaii]|uniref:Uncharacterized protein n=1 Tax=Orchesella dallaii TaxID=48710 RepID=A0ABP1PTA2_9HEXA